VEGSVPALLVPLGAAALCLLATLPELTPTTRRTARRLSGWGSTGFDGTPICLYVRDQLLSVSRKTYISVSEPIDRALTESLWAKYCKHS